MKLLESLGLDSKELQGLFTDLRGLTSFEFAPRVSVSENLSLPQICHFLATLDPPPRSLEITTRERRVIPETEYCLDETGRVDAVAIERLIIAGSTLMVTDVRSARTELSITEVHDSALSLEVNLFLSGPLTQAYPAHFDLLDAVIVQVLGSKGWQLWPTLPSSSSLRDSARASAFGESSLSILLRPGDVVLMPAYTPHLVASTFEPSVHVAFALRGYSTP